MNDDDRPVLARMRRPHSLVAPQRHRYSLVSHTTAEDVLRTLYLRMWRFCAGWNRCVFMSRQLSYIWRKWPSLHIWIGSLGSVEAMTVVVDSESYIVLNRTLLPWSVNDDRDARGIIRCLDGPGATYARFVFLHELGHLLLHREAPGTWETTTPEGFWPRAMARERTASVDEVIQEIEADIYALVAMVPDYAIYTLRKRHRGRTQLRMQVARMLAGTAYPAEHPTRRQLHALAEYRLTLFDKLSHLFRRVSEAEPDGIGYRRFITIEGVEPDQLRSENHAVDNVDLLDMACAHPRVLHNDALLQAMRVSDSLPFLHLDAP